MKKFLKVTIASLLLVSLFAVNAKAGFYYMNNDYYSHRASSWTYEAPYDPTYNCLGYATGSMKYEWPWGSGHPTDSLVTIYLNTKGYSPTSVASAPIGSGIISYGTTTGITHFSKVTGFAQVTAKWGELERFKHDSRSPYPAVNSGSDSYGILGYGVAIRGYKK